MNKNVKFICFLILLIILIILMAIILNTNVLNYTLKVGNKKFKVNQVKKDELYSLEIKYKNKIFYFENLKVKPQNRKIVDKIYYYEDSNYYCLLPIVNGKALFDINCYSNDILYNYHDIVGKNESLDKFANSIKQYDVSLYTNDTSKYSIVSNVKIFDNYVDKNIVLTTYNGIISNKQALTLFQKDVYNNKISAFLDNYYVIADYDNDYEFDYFYIVDLNKNKIEKIKCPNAISFDSYIQGIVDGIIYLYDKDNELQYSINPSSKTIKVFSSDKIKYYKNNKWQYISKATANKEMLFDYNDLSREFSDYDKVEKTDNYYYLFKKENDTYNLFRVSKKNIDVVKYILNLNTLHVKFNDDCVYFTDNQKLYFYSDSTGLKTLMEYSELNFNDTIKFYVY